MPSDRLKLKSGVLMFELKQFLASKSGSLLVVETESVSPHFETGLEIALTASKAGWRVHFLYLGNSLYPTGSGWTFYSKWLKGQVEKKKWPKFSLERVQRNRWLIKQAIAQAQKRRWDFRASIPKRVPNPSFAFRVPVFHTVEDLENWEHNGRPVGKYIASSAISQSNNARFEPKQAQNYIDILGTVYQAARNITETELRLNDYDVVCVFNGRFAETGGVVDAVDQTNTVLLFHERGANDDRYFVRPWRPHEVRHIGTDFLSLWSRLTVEERAQQAGICASLLEAAAYDGGLGPRTFSSNKKFSSRGASEAYDIVFFPTSDDEFESVANLNLNGNFQNQADAIVHIARACEALDLTFAVRVHPNTENKHISDWKWWNEILPTMIPHHRVIRSDEEVNSYDLIKSARVVVVNGSSVGIEALWRGKPVLAVCDTVYEFAGADILRPGAAGLEADLVSALNYTPDKSSVLPTVFGGLVWGDQFEHLNPRLAEPFGKRRPLLWKVDEILRGFCTGFATGIIKLR